MVNKSLNLLQPISLPGRDIFIPYVKVADGAFALGENILKPYPGHQMKGRENF